VDDQQSCGSDRMSVISPPISLAQFYATLGITGPQPSRWITRERPKIDRIACPWLIRRFVDAQAEFFYVPTAQVFDEARRLNAVAYDIPGAPITHVGELCSFDAVLRAFGLQDPALAVLATIVRGADTDRLDLAPQSAGLLALSTSCWQRHCLCTTRSTPGANNKSSAKPKPTTGNPIHEAKRPRDNGLFL
jgi:hypothetical protein